MSLQVGSELLKVRQRLRSRAPLMAASSPTCMQRLLEAVPLDLETLKQRNLTHLLEYVNGSLRLVNGTLPRDLFNLASNVSLAEEMDSANDYINSMPSVKAFFYCLYIMIFAIGVSGNALVCFVVIRNKSMQTVTNVFIMNLALSDILLCMFAVPFTPLYLLTFRFWVSHATSSFLLDAR